MMDEHIFIELFVNSTMVYWQNQSRSFCITKSIIKHTHFSTFYIIIPGFMSLNNHWKLKDISLIPEKDPRTFNSLKKNLSY